MSSGPAATVLGPPTCGAMAFSTPRSSAGVQPDPSALATRQRVGGRGALVCARTALPVVAASRQQVLAVSVLTCERMLAGLDGRPSGWLSEPSRRALAGVPHAAQWARDCTRNIPITPKAFRQSSAPTLAIPQRRESRRVRPAARRYAP